MKYTRWLWIAALLSPLGGCGDSGSSDEPAQYAVIGEAGPSDDSDSSAVIPQDVLVEDSAAVELDTSVPEPEPEDVAIADLGAPELPAPEDTSVPADVPLNLTGQDPPSAQALPSLAGVVDTTGAPALEDQLKNHWSVLWFYPLASTSG